MKDYCPGYHYHPKENWMNDPCGLIQHQGVYHLFHQYNPHGDKWNDMHWAHAISKDMIHWEEKEIAMRPATETLGEEHCFTGCGYHLPDGRAAFFYTSIDQHRNPEQWQAMPQDKMMTKLVQTRENAMTYSLHEKNMDVSEWRDPSILPYNDGYLMVLGCRLSLNGSEAAGAALLYTSKDGTHFSYHSILAQADGGEDYSWECPNFFRLKDKYVLLYSPYRQPLYKTGYLTDNLEFIVESCGTVTVGGHEGYYAPQSFQDEKGRQLIMAWMPERSRGLWDGIKGWAGCMTLPKEVYLDHGVLKMRVIPEAETLITSSKSGTMPLISYAAGEQYRIIIDATLDINGTITAEVLASPDGVEKTIISLHENGRLVVDRKTSSIFPTHHSLLERRITLKKGKIHMEIYVDHSVIEVSGNDEWIATRIYPSKDDAVLTNLFIQNGTGNYTLSQMNSFRK